MFQRIRDWWERRWALRHMRAEERIAGEGFKKYFGEQIQLAREAVHRGDRRDALRIWNEMHARFPYACMISNETLNLLLDLGSYDEADSMMQKGRMLRPHVDHFGRGYVRVAHRRGNAQETLRRCEVVRKRYPRVAEGYTIASECLTELDRHDEAAALIERGRAAVPESCEIYIQRARNATRRRDWQEAALGWEVVWNRFGEVVGAVAAAQSLKELRLYTEAERFLTEANVRFEKNVWVLMEWANLITAKGDLSDGVARWTTLLMKFPYFAPGYIRGAETMYQAGRENEADELLGTAVMKIPSDLRIHLDYARSAQRPGDRATAAERWALVRERFPDCTEAREQEAQTLAAVAKQS
jgi:tetratricopeptide (TPR) repeat protein